MSEKLLNAFADDRPDLHRQIGCMSGLLQKFDRRHLLAGRHLGGPKRLPSGNLGSHSHQQFILEENLIKSMNENRRTSVESSRLSFSSSSGCSSCSSLECNKSTQHHENFTFQKANFQETSSRNFRLNVNSANDRYFNVPAYASPHVGCQSLDIRGVVKESIYRDNHSALSKSTGGVKKNPISHEYSPRPVPLSKSKDGTFFGEKNGKSRVSLNVNDSLGFLASSNQPHCLFSDLRELHRSSYEAKEDSFFSVSKDSPRLSCDSYVKSATKVKELPRLSLDSRESAMRSSSSNLKDLVRNFADERISSDLASNRDFAGNKNPSNIVAKLMGLETMPRSSCGLPDLQFMSSTSCRDVIEGQRNAHIFSNSPKAVREKNQDWLSPKRSNKDKCTVQRQTTTSRVPIEPAPWMHQEKKYASHASKFGCRKTPMRQRQESVYYEIDKKLEELELLQSSKDVRALKQILEAIQAKRRSETKKSKEQQQASGRESRLDRQNPIRYDKTRSVDCHRSKSIESPIVIMKPAKSMKKCSSPTSTIPLEGLAELHKVQVSDLTDNKKKPISNRTSKDKSPKNSPKVALDHLHASRNKKSISCVDEANLQRQHIQRIQGSSSHQLPSSDRNGSSLKTSGSSSPRTQQRKLEHDKKSRSSASSESSKTGRQSKQSSGSVSPRAKLRFKQGHMQQTEISHEPRHISYQSNEISMGSDISLASPVDSEVIVADQSTKLGSSTMRNTNRDNFASIGTKKSLVKLREKSSSSKLEGVNCEQPSPISILDASFYKDDLPSSPANEMSRSIKDGTGVDSPLVSVLEIDPTSEIKQNRLGNIDILVQKLGQLTLSEEEMVSANQIVELCNTQDPNNQYILEVLVASGLLFQGFRLHQSGHAINSDLFLVLEQRRSDISNPRYNSDGVTKQKSDAEKLHRKLLFDVVDEILIQKLALDGTTFPPRTQMPSGLHMLRELCSEINQLQADSLQVNSSNEEENDSLKMILSRHVASQSRQWNSLGNEISGIVLDIERSIFKELVDEVMNSDLAVSLQLKSSRPRRQLLFAK